jgi:N-acetylglucosaminyl-diphospho-decaprenol L-rhamnosyltransferase
VIGTASIVVLSYNTRDLTLEVLARFALDAQVEGWQVILVDNGSTDGTADAVHRDFPSVEVIQSDTNRGYAAGNNLGLTHTTGHIVILLNSDVLVGMDQLRALVAYMDDHPEVGAASAGLCTPTGNPQAFAFGGEPTPCYLLRRGLRRILDLAPLGRRSPTGRRLGVRRLSGHEEVSAGSGRAAG